MNYTCNKLSCTNLEFSGLTKLAVILIPLMWDQTGELLGQLVLGQTGEHLDQLDWVRPDPAHVQRPSLFQKMPSRM